MCPPPGGRITLASGTFNVVVRLAETLLRDANIAAINYTVEDTQVTVQGP